MKTLAVSDDLMREVESAAAAKQTTVDEFVESALRQALPLRIVPHPISGFPTFERRPGMPTFTTEDVRRAQDEDPWP